MSSITTHEIVAPEHKPWPRRRAMFGIHIDAVTMAEASSVIQEWLADKQSSECRYVVTPNVDHVVMLQENRALQEAYTSAALVLADGWPIVAASRLLRRSLPQRVAGSDLVPRLFATVDESTQLRTYLFGAAPGVGLRAATRIQRRWPGVKIVGVDSPPIGFEHHAAENEAILSNIAAADVDLLIIGLGAPKQELWVHTHQHALRAKVAICAGATIDFLAGEKKRAPRWVQRVGLEWLHRLCSEPKRLAKRYARDGIVFPRILWREMRK